MYTTPQTAHAGGIRSTARRVEAWLDQRGKWAWIATMVLGFVLFWPVGLALLAYMIWGKQMFQRSSGQGRQAWRSRSAAYVASQPTGNHAFDSYKAEALRRLEEEQAAFEAFLQRLRNSKDKSEFDAFMEDRARATAEQDAEAAAAKDDNPRQAKAADARPGEY